MSDAPSATPSWEPPSTEELGKLLPQYEIEKLLGRGGMGAVFKGRQISLDRPIAIKILSSDLDAADASFAGRFQNEARAMARMSHPGIVEVYQFGRTDTGLLYIVMEFIEGTDVAKMIARKGKLPVDHALAITAHVCDALQYAHDRGIVHRDIKPANIMVGYDGVVKVADFGLAKATESEESGLTRSGTALGTLHFMAPESLILGSVVDHRADLYAVGVMLYQMLTGKLPRGVFKLPSSLMEDMDHRFDDILKKALREDRDVRYQSAAELRTDLDAILTQPVAKVEADATHAPAALATMERPQRPADGPGNNARPAAGLQKTLKPSSLIWPTLLAVLVLILWASQHWRLTIETSPPEEPPAQSELVAEVPAPVVAPASEPAATVSSAPPGKIARITDLLPLADPERDKLAGKWQRVPEGILCEVPGRLQLPHVVTTEEFDYEYEFSLVSPTVGWVCVRFPSAARRIPWTVQEHRKKTKPFYHFPFIDNAPAAKVTEVVVQRPEILLPGKHYHCVLKVRKDSLEAVWNEAPILHWEGDLRRFRHDGANPTKDPRYLDIGVNSGSVLFHKVQVTEFFDASQSTNKNAQPPAITTTDRNVAKWVLGKGGHVWIYGSNAAITRVEDLPSGEFVIKKLAFWDHVKSIKEPIMGTQDLLHLQGLQWLRELELRANPIGDAGLEILADIPSLMTLRVHACGVSDAGLSHISKVVDLETLDLGYSRGRITDAGAAHLLKLTKLRWLNIYDSRITDKTLTEVLAKLPSLNWVELTSTQVTTNGVLTFKKAKPKCRVVKHN